MANIKDQYVRVNIAPVDAVGGSKPEPEERPADLVSDFDTSKPLAPASNSDALPFVGISRQLAVPGRVAQTGTVIQWADRSRRMCNLCANWDHAAGKRIVNRLRAGLDGGAETLNQLRGLLACSSSVEVQDMSRGLAGDIEVEHALNLFGVCSVLTDMSGGEQCVMHAKGFCPENIPNCFHPRDRKAAIAAGMNYDDIMHAAQGAKK